MQQMNMNLNVCFFFFIPAMIKDFHLQRGGKIADVQQLIKYCLPFPQTVSNYHAYGNFAYSFVMQFTF